VVIPVGDRENQELVRARMENGALKCTVLFNCKFVLLLGRYGWNRRDFKSSQE
jgi:hypothetical protein